MATEMIMPKVDMDQETGTVVEWLKSNGQNVEEGETILVIETDKIAIDVEAPGTGILNGISANPGDVVPIGTVIAYILDEGEELPDLPTDTQAPVQITPSPAVSEIAPAAQDVSATPVARKMAQTHGIDLSTLEASGSGGKITKADSMLINSLSTRVLTVLIKSGSSSINFWALKISAASSPKS